MRFTIAIVAGIVAIVNAQETTNTAAAAQESTKACLDACADGDVNCKAICIGVPNPTEEMVSMNDACISACPVGSGTEADISAYSSCQGGCISSYYYNTGGVAAPTATSGSGGSEGSGSEDTDGDSGSGDSDDSNDSEDDEATDGEDDGDSSQSQDGDDSADDEGNSAGILAVSGSAFGLVVFLAGFVAL